MIYLKEIQFCDPPGFRILAITDMHIGDGGLRTPERYYLDLTLRNIDILKPDIVINAGDILHVMGASGYEEWLARDKHAEQRLLACWRLYRECFVDRCPVPILDVCLERDKPRWSAARGTGFSHGYRNEQATFVALCLEEDVRIDDALLAELEQHAAACGGTLVLAMHYPVEGTCRRETSHWVRQSAELKALIAKHCRLGIIVAGHWHGYFTNPPVKERNVILCFGGEVNTLSKNGNQPWGKVIDCHDDTVTVTHWDFERELATATHSVT